jgi:hypothetical protein
MNACLRHEKIVFERMVLCLMFETQTFVNPLGAVFNGPKFECKFLANRLGKRGQEYVHGGAVTVTYCDAQVRVSNAT